MLPPIFALSPYPHVAADLVLSIHSFLLFRSFSLCLFVSISLCISSSWVLGVAGMQCWVWLGCGGVSWIVDLYGGSWWVFAIMPQTPKGLKHEKDVSSTCKFFFSFLTIQSTKIISSTNIKNYHNNSIKYTLKVSQSSKQ